MNVDASYLMGIARHLTLYGYVRATCDDVPQLLKDLEETYGLQAREEPRGLERGQHFIVNPEVWDKK